MLQNDQWRLLLSVPKAHLESVFSVDLVCKKELNLMLVNLLKVRGQS